MQDQPDPLSILATVADFLRDSVIAEVRPHIAFQVRVAANAVDLARRQIELAPQSDAAEVKRLSGLVGSFSTLTEGTEMLARDIASGALGTNTPGLIEHLWATTLAKLAVDQPGYSGYQAALASPPTAKGV